jgi:hypothetical protein
VIALDRETALLLQSCHLRNVGLYSIEISHANAASVEQAGKSPWSTDGSAVAIDISSREISRDIAAWF